MTDITELALLVSKAKASVFTLEYISQFEPADIDSDDVDLRFEVDGMDTGTNVSIVDECGQAAKVIGVLVEALEKAQEENTAGGAGMAESYETIISMLRSRIAELESRTVNPEDTDGVREEDNKFLVVRHPGKVPVIKHPVGQLDDYLLQILKADPLATIDIVTHRYYGVGGQFVEDADEYLHEIGIKMEAE